MDFSTLALAVSLIAAAVSFAVPALLKTPGPVRSLAIGGADYVEALKEAVELAETTGALRRFTGAEKLALAIKKMENYLEDAGIHGNAKAVTLDRARADIELMRLQLFPKP